MKAGELSSKVKDAETRLELARENATPYHHNSNGNVRSLYIKGEIREVIQVIVVAAIAKELAELKAEYEAL